MNKQLKKKFQKLGITIGKMIGNGKSGDVFDCKFEDKNCVVKIIDQSSISGDEFDFFIVKSSKEASAQMDVAELGLAPKIMKYDYIEDEMLVFIVMEKIIGSTFYDWYDQHKDSERLSIIMEITDKIKLMNSKGIYHRDMHGDNIMITNNNRIVFIDFGMVYMGNPADMDLDDFEDTVLRYNGQRQKSFTRLFNFRV